LTISEAKRRRWDRRRQVFEFWKQNLTIADMASRLGVDEKTVDRDLKTPGVQEKMRQHLRDLEKEYQKQHQEWIDNMTLEERDLVIQRLTKLLYRRRPRAD